MFTIFPSVSWVRSFRVWKWILNYFPIDLIKTAEMPADRNYLVCVFPHGILRWVYCIYIYSGRYVLRIYINQCPTCSTFLVGKSDLSTKNRFFPTKISAKIPKLRNQIVFFSFPMWFTAKTWSFWRTGTDFCQNKQHPIMSVCPYVSHWLKFQST